MAFKLRNTLIHKDKILTVVFFITVFIYLLEPVQDVDFPWHLKSGEYIVTHKTIPEDDPFSFPHEGVMGEREKFQLAQYWLAQVIYYLLYSAGGLPAIVIFSSAFFLLFFVLLWIILKRKGLYYPVILSVFTLITLDPFRGTNPQMFSTVFALFLIFLLEKFRREPASQTPLFFIPLLMLLWANFHGGFIFGLAIILIYISTETIKHYIGNIGKLSIGTALNSSQLRSLVLWGLVSIFITYLNPNGFKALEITFEPYIKPAEFKGFYSGVRGYLNPVQLAADPYSSKLSNISFWILLGYISIVVLFRIIRKKTIDLTSFSLIAFTIVTSLSAVRYVTFFVGAAIPLMVDYNFFKEQYSFKKLNSSRIIFGIFLVLFLAVIVWQLNVKGNPFGLRESRLYPVRAMNFLMGNPLSGNIFNSYNKGGFFIWKLYPKYKNFHDTRVLNIEKINEGYAISNAYSYWGEPASSFFSKALASLVPKELGEVRISVAGIENDFKGKPLWKELLDHYKIDIVAHEASSFFTGEIFPLVLRLMKDDGWSLIYFDGNVVIFLRNKPEYKDILEKLRIPKEFVFTEIVLEVSPFVRSRVPHPAFYSSLALAFVEQNRLEEAKIMIEAALALNKKDITANVVSSYIVIKENSLKKKGRLNGS